MVPVLSEPVSPETDKNGFYGEFGGAFVPELLQANVAELQEHYLKIIEEITFQREYRAHLKDYVGRPTPLYYARRLSEHYDLDIYLKREDLNHTGSHKINNALGQILLARRLGKTRIIAETGAGQHGVAAATVCAQFGMSCTVYMGTRDMERQLPNVQRMKMLGATVVAVNSGSCTLKDATNEAIRDWINHPDGTHYIIGSAIGPHPYPDMVARFQSVISEEMKKQLKSLPKCVIACVGGGSNAIGAFYHYLDEPTVKLVGVEAAGKGVETDQTAATLAKGTPGILHACSTVLLQDEDGQVVEPYSISAGLDYPGIGPIHAWLSKKGRVHYTSVTDEAALKAAALLCKKEGIIPALESAHALAYLEDHTFNSYDTVVINLSGRGDKDMGTYMEKLGV